MAVGRKEITLGTNFSIWSYLLVYHLSEGLKLILTTD